MTGRLGIDNVSPVISLGQYPAKGVVGQVFPVSATVWREGHDAVSATLVVRRPAGSRGGRAKITMTPETGDNANPDRRHAVFTPDVPGIWTFRVDAWADPAATWYDAIAKKVNAGQSAETLANDLEVGARFFERAEHKAARADTAAVHAAVTALRDESLSLEDRLAPAFSEEVREALRRRPVRDLHTRGLEFQVHVEPLSSSYGAWYEFFPRSTGGRAEDGTPIHGTFRTAEKELPRIADMGFDTVYLPPIHPIGEVNRKGKNNSLTPTSEDVGSPWAIGSAAGGHDAVHPELGTVKDFIHFRKAAEKLGLKVALDLALQCAPDHPWAAAHPEWFTVLPDGSIAYAENPPKKYQDIYPLNFDTDAQGLYSEVLRVVRLWIERGVRIFRVDNPHTKPANFWAWLIHEIHSTDPDVVFLAEAFTRPPRLYGLAKLGFTQSYSYFTWKTNKEELTEFAESIASGADVFRPNLFVNTPDILHESLQKGGRAMFAQRAALAATMSPLWGVYSGYELYEHEPVREGSEEYLDSEKYELRPRDFDAAEAAGESLAPWLRFLNDVRRQHPALHQQRNLHLHETSNDSLLAYSRVDPITGDAILVVVNLDSRSIQEGSVTVDLPAVGLAPKPGFPDDLGIQDSFPVTDLPTEQTYTWSTENYVRLDPDFQVAHIFQLPTVPEERRTALAFRDEDYDPRG
ncbi:alpha-1,4-glucan--maltose-1-phosphate maltosyltransferase [Corynebacterium heidelbergense]|uniref:Alpha-1,4-glucan:maltose-1-phosphate maltosyltransferase n=1 Tax=Corynebacterium heidelbergense TaxID=2055947 RepID=A0A364V7D6_9CORY|nr:alpha-1,4-glucan--maltose-1-phosphate maltosyltransferase [Corynebacterium heidelbergense]RAV32549.1 alpha-1,4-glucan--maltose-1-phosphate maltosyltransferase [Corynebacterium heidelbergense]